MTVNELIVELEKMPKDAVVRICAGFSNGNISRNIRDGYCRSTIDVRAFSVDRLEFDDGFIWINGENV